MITLGKHRDQNAWRRVTGFVNDPVVLPKIFGTFAARYAARPGGYTRIHKFGNREGDNAPQAVLELVDNPRDIKLEVTAKALGWEMLKARLQTGNIPDILQNGVKGAREFALQEVQLDSRQVGQLRPATRFNLQKVLKFRDSTVLAEISQKAEDHIVSATEHIIIVHNSHLLRGTCWRNPFLCGHCLIKWSRRRRRRLHRYPWLSSR